jgi:hypothetical protein
MGAVDRLRPTAAAHRFVSVLGAARLLMGLANVAETSTFTATSGGVARRRPAPPPGEYAEIEYAALPVSRRIALRSKHFQCSAAAPVSARVSGRTCFPMAWSSSI